jgi:hypothetical protein
VRVCSRPASCEACPTCCASGAVYELGSSVQRQREGSGHSGWERMGGVRCAYTAEAYSPTAFHAPIHTRVMYSHCGTEQALNGGLGAVLRRTEGVTLESVVDKYGMQVTHRRTTPPHTAARSSQSIRDACAGHPRAASGGVLSRSAPQELGFTARNGPALTSSAACIQLAPTKPPPPAWQPSHGARAWLHHRCASLLPSALLWRSLNESCSPRAPSYPGTC